MHLMLQNPTPDDYVIATGETHTVRELCELAFSELGLDYRNYVKVDERLETSAANVWAMGDCAGSPQFTHVSFDDFRVVHAVGQSNHDTINRDSALQRILIVASPCASYGRQVFCNSRALL